jgi:CDP-glucose 4,6-dehydratase
VSRSVLVTGAQGLVGSWLAAALLDAGDEVVAVERDRPPIGALELHGIAERVTRVAGDVTDGAFVERVLADYEVQDVFHLAAQTLVGTARRAPVATFEVNVAGTWTVLDACRRVGVERVVVASSDKAYGPASRLPSREEDPLRARHPYDASKAAADIIARSYWHTYGLPVAVTRLANVYGGADLNASRLVPEAVAAALTGRPPVLRSDGTPERDFLHVEDAVAAYLAIRDALGRGAARGAALNAGSGRAWPVGELVRLVCQIAGSDVEPDIRGAGTPAGEISRQLVDASRLRALTGWEPRLELEEGLRRTVEWYRAHRQALAAAPVL